MLVHALMAGGVGSRLYGSNGGLKPLEPIVVDHLLIDYVLDEGRALRPSLYLLAIGDHGQPILDHVRRRVAAPALPVYQSTAGTGGAVVALLEASPPDATILLTTADLHGDPGAISGVLSGLDAVLEEPEPLCVIAVSPRLEDDTMPIHVHTSLPRNGDRLQPVARYGKGIEPSPSVFSGARILNGPFAQLLLTIARDGAGGWTDTQLMAQAVELGARVFAVSTPSVFDIDDQGTLARARILYQARSARPSPATNS